MNINFKSLSLSVTQEEEAFVEEVAVLLWNCKAANAPLNNDTFGSTVTGEQGP